jgi:glycosyltransferase involved in cell wall biosynthesis
MKRVLMIAYHYPPLAGSSGIQRTLRFSQDLPSFGWQPSVLSTHPTAYENTSDDLLQDIPAGVEVFRAFALDARRHLSLFNRYPGWIARPDRWLSWLFGAVPTGLRMIQQHRPDVIWSTYPIPTAHLIGYWLSRLSGLPWVADFRDPMAHDGYPADPNTWHSYLKVEQKVFAQASRMVFTTPGAARFYQSRYPTQASRIQVIENGYDESSFTSHAPDSMSGALSPGKVTLLHSGIVYPEWRNPRELFAALRQLIDDRLVDATTLILRFRAPEHAEFLAVLAASYGLDNVVQILPPIGYQAALAEMCAADGLLVLQSADCNDQIPAKVYEYIRARKPVLGLCGASGDTAEVLQRAGMVHLAPLESAQLIGATLISFLTAIQRGTPPNGNHKFVESNSRFSKANDLAQLLDAVRLENLNIAS